MKDKYKIKCSHCPSTQKEAFTYFIKHHLLIPNAEVRRCFICGIDTLTTTDGKEFNKD